MSTAQDRAYATIRRAILNGEFPPGSQLRQEELAEQFDMSRTSVRYAIQALADDGLIEIGEDGAAVSSPILQRPTPRRRSRSSDCSSLSARGSPPSARQTRTLRNCAD